MLKRVDEPPHTPGQSVSLGKKVASPAATDEPKLFPLRTDALGYRIGERHLLRDISLCLGGRSRTIVMGPNGAGKSLLLRLLHGLITPTCGQVTWNGAVADDAIRKSQAFVFQRPVLLRRTASGNVAFVLSHLPAAERFTRTAEVLEQAGLAHIADTPARKLSGGEQQRLSIARAIALRPNVLFLDEPTASLDPANVAAVEAMANEAHRAGIKIIMITHDIGQAKRLADEIVFLNAGRMTERTNAADFFSKPKSEAARAYLEGRLLI